MNSVESLQNRGKGAAVTRKHGYKINTASIEAQHAAEEMMLQIENDMKNASAKLAAEQAERMVKDSIAASMERIKNENENMRTWEENMVRRSGYTVDGKSIHREAVVDSTIGKTYYEGQSVHYYEDFYDAGPTVSVSLSKTMLEGLNSSAIMLLVEQANYDIENWSKQVFGDTEKDDEGNVVLKQNAVAREASYDNDIERYKALSKKDYDKLSEDEQKELNNLSTGIVSVRDGLLGEWTGYAPVFKDGNSGLDLSNSRESNIKYQGSGQMGQIMLDFQWNCMIEQQGWQKVALPAYDQPLWRGNGSWFEPPTIRGVASIVFEIVGQASSQTWFSYADDVIFAAIDLGGGFKSAEQVGLDLAKTAATAVISMGCSSAGSAVGNIAGKAMEGASKFANFAAQAGISAATTYVSTVATSAVSSVYIGADGNLAFDGEGFGKSTYSASTIAGALGAGFTAGLNEIALGTRYDKVKDPDTGKMKKEYTHTRATGLSSVNAANIQALNGLAGGLLTNAIEYAVDGQTTFNLLNSSLFGVGSVGMLEFTIGKEGVKSKFGMGGTNISVNNLINSMIGAKDWNTSEKITKYAEGMDSLSPDDKKKLANALRANYGFGDKKQLENLDEILKGETELRKDGTDGKAQTIVDADSHKTIMMALSEGMDWKELGLLIGHEAYRDGIVSDEQAQRDETREAVKGHTEMAEKMLGDVLYAFSMSQLIDNNQNLQMDLLARALGDDIFNAYIDGTYDSSADYWKLMSNGTLVQDKDGWLRDENDNFILDKDGNKIGHKNQETGLLNILFAKQADGSYKNPGKEYKDFSPLEKIISSQIMEKSGISYYYPDEGKTGIYNRMWNKDGKALDMNLVMGYAGDSVATAVFMNFFDEMTNSMIDGNTSIASVVSGYKDSGYLDRLIGYYSAKNEFYNGSRKLFDKGDLSRMRISGEFQTDSYYPDGQHKGIDFASAKDKDGNKLIDFDTEEINTYAFYSGKVVGEKLNTTNSGYSIILEYGFDFENLFYSTGVQAQYMHLKEESALSVGNKVTPNTKIGIIGNTDGGTGISTGEHLHYQLMGNLGGLNYDDSKWNMNSGRRDYYLNKLGIPSTSNYSRIPNNIQNYYVGEANYKKNGVWKKSKYYNYYYNTNPIWQRMGLSSY